MDQEGSLRCLSDSTNAEHVIKVGVRRDNSSWRGVDIFDEPQDSLGLASWIDNYCFSSRLKDVAVRLQVADHNSMYLRQEDPKSCSGSRSNTSYNHLSQWTTNKGEL